jgi:HAD superfamily hydrolase (TIGR01490 family)
VSLAIFDLDNTLLGGDSDYLWGRFLVKRGIVDRTEYEAANARFYEDYRNGVLDIAAFLHFALQPLAANSPERLGQWRKTFIEEEIKPIMLADGQALIAKHKAAGDTLLVITATNRFVTEPIVELFGIEHLLATIPEIHDGRFTGRFVGDPCFQEGKVRQLEHWLARSGETLNGSWFYSDSHNDLPLLERVDHPVAVDPDETLQREAERRSWPIISLRESSPLHFSTG